MSVTHLGQALKVSESQLAISLYFAQGWAETTDPEAHYKHNRERLAAIMKSISKKDDTFILQTHFPNLIKHEFVSLDACFARLSLYAYSKTIVWSLSIPGYGCATVLSNDSKPLEPVCMLFVPSTGDLHVFKNGIEEAKDFIQNAAAVNNVTAYVWQKAEEVNEATPPMPDIVATATQEATPVAEVVVVKEEPAAPPPPIKKKAVRKRPQPVAAVAVAVEDDNASATKKQATDA